MTIQVSIGASSGARRKQRFRRFGVSFDFVLSMNRSHLLSKHAKERYFNSYNVEKVPNIVYVKFLRTLYTNSYSLRPLLSLLLAFEPVANSPVLSRDAGTHCPPHFRGRSFTWCGQ